MGAQFYHLKRIPEVGNSRMGQLFSNAVRASDSVSFVSTTHQEVQPHGCKMAVVLPDITSLSQVDQKPSPPRAWSFFVSQQTLLLSHWLGLCLSRGHHWLGGTQKSEGGDGSDWCWMSHAIVSTILPACPKEQTVENNSIAQKPSVTLATVLLPRYHVFQCGFLLKQTQIRI